MGRAGDVANYQPYWVTIAAAHSRQGDKAAAIAAGNRAISLTENTAIRAYLRAGAAR